jgi:hypothetical protein
VRSVLHLGVCVAAALLSACGGGNGGGSEEALPGKQATYTVGGVIAGLTTVTGQTAPAVRIDNVSQTTSAMQSVTVNGNGSFTFPGVPSGTPYELAITSPPGHVCIFDTGSANGRVENASISNHGITCTVGEYSVGGAVSGLGINNPGLQLSLTVGGQSTSLSLSTDGLFTFPNPRLTSGTQYSVSMAALHGHYVCTLNGGSGSVVGNMGSSNVTNLVVNCAAPVRVSVTGLTANSPGLVLSNLYTTDASNTTRIEETLSIPGNVSAFPFATRLPSGRQYAVSVGTLHPQYDCSIIGGSGVVGTIAINIQIVCQPVPTITATGISPSANAVNVPRATRVFVGLSSGNINWDTVNVANVTLTSQYGSEPITVMPSFPGPGIQVIPMQTLRRFTAYTLTVSTGIRAYDSRIGLAAPLLVNFTTADELAWVTPARISSTVGTASNPQVVFDAASNAIAVWEQWDGTATSIWSNRYLGAIDTWGMAAVIENESSSNAGNPQIAIDASGNAVAAWQQTGGSIWSNRYVAANGAWGTATLVTTGNPTGDHSIAMSANGDALAVWRQYDGARENIQWSRYTVATGAWSVAAPLETDDSGNAFTPKIKTDAFGNALAVWPQFDGVRSNILANRYTAATGAWGAATLIESDNIGNAAAPQIAFDGSGNAVAVWTQVGSGRTNVWSNRYSAAGNVWGTAALVENNVGHAFAAQIAVDANGNAGAVWSYMSGGSTTHIRSSRSGAGGTSWGSATALENNPGSATEPQVAIDTSGNTIAIWQQPNGGFGGVWWSRYAAAGSAWSTPRPTEVASAIASSPKIIAAANGVVLAVWAQSDGTQTTIWASRLE